MAGVILELQAVSGSQTLQPLSSANASEPGIGELISDLAPVDRGKDAWMFVGASFVLETFIWGFGFTYGVFQNYYLNSASSPFLGSTPTAISAVGTASLGVQYIGGMGMLTLCKRWPQHVKPMLWSALFVGCGSLFVSSFAKSVWQLILLQGILPGIAGGLLYAPAILWLSEWFVERRGLAGGLIFGGSGVGGTVFPPLVGILLETLGFRWTLRIWACIMALCAGCAVWIIKPRIRASSARDARVAPTDWTFLKSPVFAVVAVTLLIQALSYFPVSLYIATYTSSLGLPPLDGQLVLSSFNLFSVVGQIIFGHLCDRMPYSRVMFVSGVGSAAAAYLLWGFAKDLGLVFAFVVIFGCLSGGFSSIEPPAASEVAGTNAPLAGIIIGTFGAMKGIAAIVGPMVAGSLYHPSQSLTNSEYGGFGFGTVTLFVGGMSLATALCSVVAAVTSHVVHMHTERHGRNN